VLATPTTEATTTPPEAGTVAAYLAQAAERTVAGDVRSAIASLDEALAIDSRSFSVRFALGQSHAALAQWVRVHTSHPDSLQGWRAGWRACPHAQLGCPTSWGATSRTRKAAPLTYLRPHVAEKVCGTRSSRLLDSSPLNAHPAGTQEASAEHFRACVEVAHEPAQRLRALTGLFVAYDKLGDGQAAVPVLREAVTLAPSDVRAKVSLSILRRPLSQAMMTVCSRFRYCNDKSANAKACCGKDIATHVTTPSASPESVCVVYGMALERARIGARREVQTARAPAPPKNA